MNDNTPVYYEHTESEVSELKKFLKRIKMPDDDILNFLSVFKNLRVYNKIFPMKTGTLTLVFYYNKDYTILFETLRANLSSQWNFDKSVQGAHLGWKHKKFNIVLRETRNSEGLKSIRSNINAFGKKLIDAVERATIVSILSNTEIKTPEDTHERFFIEHPDEFNKWLNTFKYSKLTLLKYTNIDLTKRDILHIDATHISVFDSNHLGGVLDTNYTILFENFKKIAQLCGFKNINSWCPADILIISKNRKTQIEQAFQKFVNFYQKSTIDIAEKISRANALVWKFGKTHDLIPVSLKQLLLSNVQGTCQNFNYEVFKTPKSIETNVYDNISVHHLICDMDHTKGDEIGTFLFIDNDTSKNIRMQYRGFPHTYKNAQLEIVSDGSKTGGRPGKCPMTIFNQVIQKFSPNSSETIIRRDDFGKKTTKGYFYNCTDKDFKKYYQMFDYIKTYKNSEMCKIIVKPVHFKTFDEFKDIMNEARTNTKLAFRMCQKIQGLSLIYFLLKNQKNISEIVSTLLRGAKRHNRENCYFIKIF